MSCNQSPKAAHHSTRSNASSARLPLSSRGATRGASRHSVAAAGCVWGRSRTRGGVERLPSGSLRVSVCAGIDPVSRKKHYLVETIPGGPSAARDAERVRTRLLNQVDERRNPRTKATVNQLFDRWLEVAEMETTTRNSVVGRLDRHVRSVLGAVSVSRLDAETLESLYAQLRRCRDRCGGRPSGRAHLPAAGACDGPADPREPQRRAEQCRPLSYGPATTVSCVVAACLAATESLPHHALPRVHSSSVLVVNILNRSKPSLL